MSQLLKTCRASTGVSRLQSRTERCSRQPLQVVAAGRSSINPIGKANIKRRPIVPPSEMQTSSRPTPTASNGISLFDRIEDPVLRAALKEPVAFWGGLVAGALRLNLEEDPLKNWVDSTAEQAGVSKADISNMNGRIY